FEGKVPSFEDVLSQARDGKFQAVYVAAGDPPRPGDWINAAQAELLGRVPLVIVQDLFPSPATEVAKYVLPAASFAEKDGTFVNHAGLAQAIRWAIKPPEHLYTDGRVFLNLLQRTELVHADSLRAEMAKSITYFAPMGDGRLGEHGLPLESTK